jgi:hypothetical protein
VPRLVSQRAVVVAAGLFLASGLAEIQSVLQNGRFGMRGATLKVNIRSRSTRSRSTEKAFLRPFDLL